MPLHLLSKKSWNIYASAAQARIAKDEADAAAREQEEERRMQEHDAERRLAILRGEVSPPLPAESKTSVQQRRRRDNRDGKVRSGVRKRRRLEGEDDTDRDLRLARADMNTETRTEHLVKKHKSSDAPLTDHAGHINLFPVDPRVQRKYEKNAEVEAEKKRKECELEDQYTMRFSNAAGRDGLKEGPWYSNGSEALRTKLNAGLANRSLDTSAAGPLHTEEKKPQSLDAYVESKDVWGRPDPARKSREQSRISSTDPLAFMQRAQRQLKTAEVDKKRWQEEKDEEARRLKKQHERERRHRRDRSTRRGRSRSVDSLEGFSLDASLKQSDKHRETSQFGHNRPREERRRDKRQDDREESSRQKRRNDHRHQRKSRQSFV